MAQPCRLIELSGSPYDRGVRYGRQAAPEVARSVGHYCAQAKALDVDDARLAQIVREYLPILERFDQRQIEEMRGVAAGAGVSFEQIVLLNARTELLQLAGDRFQFRIGLLQTDTWFEPRHNRVARRRALDQRQSVDVDLKRYPNFRDAWEIETWWHHTDNVIFSAVEIERLANGIDPAGETFLPKPIANERHGRPARSIFFG